MGESARLCVQSLQAAEVPFSLLRYSGANIASESDARLSALEGQDPRYFCNVWHVNADQTLAAIAHHGEQLYSGRYNIGVWHWELPELLPEWKQAADALDEIWAPSRFVLEAVRALSNTPVRLMPHGLSLPAPRSARRGQFGLPEAPFTFLSMFDVLSIPERKNPRGTLEAFRRAFPSGTEALLVIKVNNSEHADADYQAFRAEAARTPGVHLLERSLPREKVYELTGLADAIVSLHRSEGFGLGPFEAMAMGKPVIATSAGGVHRVLCDNQNGLLVAPSNSRMLAERILELLDEPERARMIGEAGRNLVRAEFSVEAMLRRTVDSYWSCVNGGAINGVHGESAGNPLPRRNSSAQK